MLSRSCSSRRRRAARSASSTPAPGGGGGGVGGEPRALRGRRASVAVGAHDAERQRRSLSPGPGPGLGSGAGASGSSGSPALLCPPEPRSYGRSPRHSVASAGAPLAEAAAASASTGCLADYRPPLHQPPQRPLSPALLQPPAADAPHAGGGGAVGAGGGRMVRSPSPYRMTVSGRGAQINLAYSGSTDIASRRASSSVSADDRRHLCERRKLSSDAGMALTDYGSVVYQLKDANMEASGTCDFVWRSLRIVYKTAAVTVLLLCVASIPLVMLIMGVQYLRDCPREPHLPMYMVVGGVLGLVYTGWLLWWQVRSRRYERLEARHGVASVASSAGSRLAHAALALFLALWFAFGNYWTLHVMWPEFEPTLFEPNRWCARSLYAFAVAHLALVWSLAAAVAAAALLLAMCRWLACPHVLRFK